MSTETKKENKKEVKTPIDYSKYTFAPEAKMEINGSIFNTLNKQLKGLLEREITQDTKIRSIRIDTRTGKEIKKVTEKNKPFSRLVFDPVATMNAQLEERITDKGQVLLKLIEILNNVHFVNVDLGNGILLEELSKRYQPQEVKPEEVADEQTV